MMMSIQAIHLVLEQSTAARSMAVDLERADRDEIIEACELAAVELWQACASACATDARLIPQAGLAD